MLVALTAMFICVFSFWVVVDDRILMPLLMDFGWSMICIGMFFVSESAFSGRTCSASAVVIQWTFSALGLLCVLLSLARCQVVPARKVAR